MIILRACSGFLRGLGITARVQLSRGAGSRPPSPRQAIQFDHTGVRKVEEAGGFWHWCITEEGRIKIGQNAILFGSLGILTITYCWNIYLVEMMRDAYMTSTDKAPTLKERLNFLESAKVGVLSDNFIRLFTSCQSRAGVNDVNFDRIDIFYSTSMDPVSQGLACSYHGAVVGLPSHSLEDQVDLSNLRLKPFYNYFHKGYRIPSNLCEEAKADLKQVLSLTPDERQFVMSRELARVDSWAALRENVHSYETEMGAITTVCKSRHQAEVAGEYYQKLINRNKVLYQILDADGVYCFTPEGEMQPLIYEIPTFTSLKSRRDYCKSLEDKLD